jgi:hypothetical protein
MGKGYRRWKGIRFHALVQRYVRTHAERMELRLRPSVPAIGQTPLSGPDVVRSGVTLALRRALCRPDFDLQHSAD